MTYKVSDIYAPDCDGGLRWDDPDIVLPWPLDGASPALSRKDAALSSLADFDWPIAYDGMPMGNID